MRVLLTLFIGLLMLGSLANGAAVHAIELSNAGEVTEATLWMHSAGDHDEVPADADKNYPHHHNQCQGHDLAAPLKACALPNAILARTRPASIVANILIAGPPATLLRPPIA